LLAARALQAFHHVNPYVLDGDGNPAAPEEALDLALVGGLLMNELIADSRGMVERPMTIQFLTGGPTVEVKKLEELTGDVLPADRTGIPPRPGGSAG
jgi:hypothetical protein